MKNIVLALIAVIGAYTLARNNIRVVPGQTAWVTHPDIFYKFLIPLLMFSSAVSALIYREKMNLFCLAFSAMLVDAVNRFAVFLNIFFMYFAYDRPGSMRPSIGAIADVKMAPSLVMLVVELLLILSLALSRKSGRP